MALNSSVKVAIPEHGVVKKRMGDKIYLYYSWNLSLEKNSLIPASNCSVASLIFCCWFA